MLKLRGARIARGWTLADLGKRTGIAVPDLSVIERGLKPAYPEWRRRISRAFRLPLSALFDNSTPRMSAREARGRIEKILRRFLLATSQHERDQEAS